MSYVVCFSFYSYKHWLHIRIGITVFQFLRIVRFVFVSFRIGILKDTVLPEIVIHWWWKIIKMYKI